MDEYTKEICKCGNEVKVKKNPRMDMFAKMLNVKFVTVGCPACADLEGVKNQEDFEEKFPNF